MPDPLTYALLRDAMAGRGAALRARVTLEPAGGPGDKVFPPTYATGDAADTKYALERRQLGDGPPEHTVLLDSVASQANRMEEALLAAWRAGQLDFPVVAVDFSDQDELGDLGTITSLEAPHRIADAILRDSLLDGMPFRHHAVGRSFTDASPKNAGAVYRLCPTALVFGVWDSTGPRGGMGTKFQRALVSEIVGVGIETGVKVGSRIDPLAIPSSIAIYARKGDATDWTADPAEAAQDKGKPVDFQRKGADKKGRPSTINHGNIAPTLETKAGGVTLREAVQTTVLSLVALRRIQFPRDPAGSPLAGDARRTAELAARTALAALGIAAIAHGRERGYDLRSRALLIPRTPLTLDLLGVDGDSASFRCTTADANALFAEAHAAAKAVGFGWDREPVKLVPSPKLSALIREARKLAESGEADVDAAEAN
ncbi:MAG: type I-U CRISPR-associated RAMP protein Csb1/Cas7u [Myxococcota bacterium]